MGQVVGAKLTRLAKNVTESHGREADRRRVWPEGRFLIAT